jgi:signal transduction histidine kinase/CheY-like chemotaxis protein
MDTKYNDSVLSEMWKSKIESCNNRLKLANYSNIFIVAFQVSLEFYYHGVFNEIHSKILMTITYGLYFVFMAMSRKSLYYTAILSFLYGEISILILLSVSFFSKGNYGIPFSLLNTLLVMFFQSYLFVSIKGIVIFTIKFAGELLFFAYFSGFFQKHMDEWSITCLITTPVYLGLCMYFDYQQDIKLINTKQQVETSMDKIEYIVGAIPDGIIVMDNDLKTVFYNARMKEITSGADTLNYLSGLQYYSRIGKQKTNFILDDILQAFNDDFGSDLNLGVTKKSDKLIEWKGKVIKWDSKTCVILYARDITRIMNLENESKENKYKSLLLRTVSHELRTPTNAVLTVAELMKESETLPKEHQEQVNIIYCSCSYLLCLINDLLDYSQMVAGCLKICIIQFNLSKLIEDCLKLIKIQIRSRPIDLKFNIDSKIPATISTDPNRLKQILLNLLGNSLKFTLSGTITLDVQINEEKLIFSILDTGIGIPSHKLSSLFQQFGKIESSMALNPQGAGLGLFISNMLTFRLGGSGIAVTSEEDIGSCFKFAITMVESTTGIFEVGKYPQGFVRPDLASGNDKNLSLSILIVDDTHFNVMAIQQILDKEGIKSEYAMNGEEAIEKVKAKTYDLILMDCEMPLLDGWETTQKLKNMQARGDIEKLPRILGNTSHSFHDIREKCLSVGMDDVIVKPCPREDLVNAVKIWALKDRDNF